MTDPTPYYREAADAEAARKRAERLALARDIAAGRALPQAGDLFPTMPGTPHSTGPQLTISLEDVK